MNIINKMFFIEARTGCSCCCDENHYRGPYETKELAELRVNYYRTSDEQTGFWPLASQYARRGCYRIHEISAEILEDGRTIINDRVYPKCPDFIKLSSDGSLTGDQEVERFCSDYSF